LLYRDKKLLSAIFMRLFEQKWLEILMDTALLPTKSVQHGATEDAEGMRAFLTPCPPLLCVERFDLKTALRVVKEQYSCAFSSINAWKTA
jgi:hypothetical protein